MGVWVFVLGSPKLTLAKKVDERGLDVARIMAMWDETEAVSLLTVTAIFIVVVIVVVVRLSVMVGSMLGLVVFVFHASMFFFFFYNCGKKNSSGANRMLQKEPRLVTKQKENLK
jgi:hypothetical protein